MWAEEKIYEDMLLLWAMILLWERERVQEGSLTHEPGQTKTVMTMAKIGKIKFCI